eukprot:gene62831-85931_t
MSTEDDLLELPDLSSLFDGSPLDEFSKAEVRALAKEFELFNHDYAASPCLRSRL